LVNVVSHDLGRIDYLVYISVRPLQIYVRA